MADYIRTHPYVTVQPPPCTDTPLVLENARDQRGTVRYQILSTQKIFHYFMHMRAKNNMGILDLFPSEFSRMRGVWAVGGWIGRPLPAG